MSSAPEPFENTSEAASVTGLQTALQEKVDEYSLLVAPVEQAIQEMQFARGMLRARAEEEINTLSPVLAALAEALDISTLDLLTARDRGAFLRQAVANAQMPVDEIRRRVLEAGGTEREELLALGIPESG